MKGNILKFVRYYLENGFYIDVIPSAVTDKLDCYDCYLGNGEIETKEYIGTLPADELPKEWTPDCMPGINERIQNFKDRYLFYTYPMPTAE